MTKIEFVPNEINKLSPVINLSGSAISKLEKVFKDRKNSFFRIDLKKGGCKGMKYIFSVVDSTEKGDVVIKKNGFNLVVKSENLKYIDNSTIDYVESFTESSFKLSFASNLDICSCGGSFSI